MDGYLEVLYGLVILGGLGGDTPAQGMTGKHVSAKSAGVAKWRP